MKNKSQYRTGVCEVSLCPTFSFYNKRQRLEHKRMLQCQNFYHEYSRGIQKAKTCQIQNFTTFFQVSSSVFTHFVLLKLKAGPRFEHRRWDDSPTMVAKGGATRGRRYPTRWFHELKSLEKNFEVKRLEYHQLQVGFHLGIGYSKKWRS